MDVQLIVRNGTVVSPTGSRRAHLIVDGGIVIGSSEHDGDLPDARTIVDAHGLHVLPGLVDTNVNFREPGQEYKEGWDTGSRAAVCGGITTIADVPNAARPLSSPEAFDEKMNAATGRSYCNFGLMATLDCHHLDKARALADAGACGVRLAKRGSGSRPWMSSGDILHSFSVAAETGLRCAAITESPDLLDHFARRVSAEGRTDAAAWQDSRPPVAEVEGIVRALAIAQGTGVKLALSSVTTAQSVGWIRRAKEDGRIDFVAETKPHYCVVDGATMETCGLGSMLKMCPPVRAMEHADAVLDGLASGVIDNLCTDHSPHTRDEKAYDDRMNGLWNAEPGWPGLETTVSLMLTAVHEGRLTIERYADCHSESPARSWGLWPRKGRLAAGADADITIVDLRRGGAFDEATFQTRHAISPFHGRKYVGAPVWTIIAGQVVAREGSVVDGPPRGRFVRPS